MIEIGKTLVSLDVVEKQFVCDLNACKGACCIHGDSGAPLEDGEEKILEEIYDDVEPYLTDKGKKAIKKYGKWLVDSDGDKVTPLVGGDKECAYTIFEDGIAFCGIEKAYRDGKEKWAKPVSCHLYPIRLTKLADYVGLNYHRWPICAPACECGSKLQVPVYRFLKDAITTKFGEAYFQELDEHYRAWKAQREA